MNILRAALGLFVVALGAWVLMAIFGSGEEASAAQTFTSSEQCKECHAQVYQEWESSWHSKSWIDEEVRSQSNDFANKDCIDCHAPRPVFESGVGNRVLPRSSRRHEGVDCITCHLLPNGGVAGTIDNPSAPCRPEIRRELQRPAFCGVCHDQHKTVQQWLATPYAQTGEDCLTCHMPFRDGDPNKGRDHTALGGHDKDLVRSAVELRGAKTDGGWQIEVENVAAGHHYPTDERSRASDLFWRPLAAGAEEGEGRWYFLYRIRDPYRFETDLPRTLIAHGETLELLLDHPDAQAGAEVGLFYNLRPVYIDPETTLQRELEDVEDPRPDAWLVHRVLLQP